MGHEAYQMMFGAMGWLVPALGIGLLLLGLGIVALVRLLFHRPTPRMPSQ